MQPLREHYERQHTDVLLEIAREDLTDEARLVLHEVLAKRGVSADHARTARARAVQAKAAQSEADKRLAPLAARLVAFAIDTVGVGIALSLVLAPLRFFSNEFYAIGYIILWLAYFLLRDSIPGQSVGKRLLGIRVVQIKSGLSCTWTNSFWRNFSHVLFVIDALFAFGRQRMRLGDMAAGTIVVRAEL
ncbi:RDD family protein [Massilia sp. W12]|uniref:RDD family protein n=1 Tax=Massilia sp. W12 TaxID=3126507 RepID=UPI0030CB6B2A